MNQQVGSGSLCFSKAPFIISTASVVGIKEGEGPLKDFFDVIGSDDKFGEANWEAAESALQKEALTSLYLKDSMKEISERILRCGQNTTNSLKQRARMPLSSTLESKYPSSA